jgi:5-methylcytosine-specific restriction endonuclease McrA
MVGNSKKGIKGFIKGLLPMVIFQKGYPPWNKGKHTARGKYWSFKEGHIPWNKGLTYKHSPETIAKMTLHRPRGENHWNWKGDKAIKKNQRNDPAYKQWRLKVLKRDEYQCFDCGEVKRGQMEADHIYSWKNYPRLRYVLENGQTLCADCHLVKTKAQLRGDYKLIYKY